jgi:chromosome segregation ATPase
MKDPILNAVLIIAVFGFSASAQPPAAGQTPPAGAPATPQSSATAANPTGLGDAEGDLYPEARANADGLKAAWEKLDTANLAEVNRLLRTRVCQSKRIEGLLNRTTDALDAWLVAEKDYYTSWQVHEKQRVADQQKSLKGMEADMARLAEVVEGDRQDREELERSRASLETSQKTEKIKSEIDNLIASIEASDTRLSEDEKQLNESKSKYKNFQTELTATLVNINQYITRLDAYEVDVHTKYQKQRETAQEICNTKQPGTTPSLPKKGGGQ